MRLKRNLNADWLIGHLWVTSFVRFFSLPGFSFSFYRVSGTMDGSAQVKRNIVRDEEVRQWRGRLSLGPYRVFFLSFLVTEFLSSFFFKSHLDSLIWSIVTRFGLDLTGLFGSLHPKRWYFSTKAVDYRVFFFYRVSLLLLCGARFTADESRLPGVCIFIFWKRKKRNDKMLPSFTLGRWRFLIGRLVAGSVERVTEFELCQIGAVPGFVFVVYPVFLWFDSFANWAWRSVGSFGKVDRTFDRFSSLTPFVAVVPTIGRR